MNTNGNYYENRLRKRESFKRLINIGLSMICLLLEISLFAYMWQFHFQFQLVDPLQKIWYRGFLLEDGIYSVILIFFSVTYGGMRLGYMKNTCVPAGYVPAYGSAADRGSDHLCQYCE